VPLRPLQVRPAALSAEGKEGGAWGELLPAGSSAGHQGTPNVTSPGEWSRTSDWQPVKVTQAFLFWWQ
jgi:hypothetical protein